MTVAASEDEKGTNGALRFIGQNGTGCKTNSSAAENR
jgi:hypothetical protein